jgi:hypothetical protein
MRWRRATTVFLQRNVSVAQEGDERRQRAFLDVLELVLLVVGDVSHRQDALSACAEPLGAKEEEERLETALVDQTAVAREVGYQLAPRERRVILVLGVEREDERDEPRQAVRDHLRVVLESREQVCQSA